MLRAALLDPFHGSHRIMSTCRPNHPRLSEFGRELARLFYVLAPKRVAEFQEWLDDQPQFKGHDAATLLDTDEFCKLAMKDYCNPDHQAALLRDFIKRWTEINNDLRGKTVGTLFGAPYTLHPKP